MDRKLIYFAALLIIIAAFIISSVYTIRDYERELESKDLIIEDLNNSMLPRYLRIDSIQKLRDENDTVTYNLPVDSLEGIFTERFSDDIEGNSQ